MRPEQDEAKKPFHFGAEKSVFKKASLLRKEMTPAEELLWAIIRGRKLNNLKFRRQHPLNKFIADFYCHELKLVLEIVGSIHNLKENK